MKHHASSEIRRHSDGSIDFGFYAARSRRERAFAVKRQFGSIGRWMGRAAGGLRGQRF